MTRVAAIVLGLVVSLVATARPPDVAASMLCQVRNKALVVRDQCKARERPLTPDRQAELGLVGPPGPAGQPGPPAGVLRVIDAVGRDVGVVIRTGGYYSASAELVGQMTLPGRSASQFVIGQVDGNGLQSDFTCRDVAVFYETSMCQGQAYADCGFGDCETVPGTYFAQPILSDGSATGCFFGEPSEIKQGDFFRRRTSFGSTVLQVNQQCFFSGGRVVSVPVQCKRGLFCADCCIPAANRSLVPVHRFDASLLGTPQFRLSR
jgi:hypothetical protein